MNPDKLITYLPKTLLWPITKRNLLNITLPFGFIYLLTGMAIGLGWIFGDWYVSPWLALIPFIMGLLGGIGFTIHALVGFVQRRRGKVFGQALVCAGRAFAVGIGQAHAEDLPSLPVQPEPLLDGDDLLTRIPFRNLGKVASVPMATNNWLQWLIFPQIILQFGQLFIQFGLRDYLDSQTATNQQAEANSGLMLYLAMFWVLFYIIFFIGLVFAATTKIKKLTIVTDEAAIRWQRFGRWVVVPWSSVQTIGAYTHPQRRFQDLTITYVIMAQDLLFTWKNNPQNSSSEADDTTDLLRIAVTRTGLPVRDLNPLATAISAQADLLAARPPKSPVFADSHTLADRAADLLHMEVAVYQSPARQWRSAVLVGLVTILALLPLLVGYGLHDIAQPTYFATLPARIHAKTPLFSDSLRATDGLWPIQSSTQDDYRHLAYTSNGYTLTGNTTGKEVYAVMPDTYGSVAIQVTATETGTIPPNTYDGVGIIMRGNNVASDPLDEYNYCTFSVNYHGDWRVACGFLGPVIGHSAAIHTGPGATNTLLVIARGNQYICYVNGQYVGQIYDRYSVHKTVGQVGVVNVESGMQGTFTDFTVWSVNAPPALDYVN